MKKESLNILTPKQSVRTEEAFWISGESFSQPLEVQLPTPAQKDCLLLLLSLILSTLRRS